MSLFTSDLVGRAMDIAIRAHDGQTDKSGNPYILHPIAVANMFVLPQFQVVALLHDVIEDNPAWTAKRLRSLQIPDRLVDAVTAITHVGNERRTLYYMRVREDPIALLVKLADIAHNSSPERQALLNEDDRERLVVKYADAKEFLLADMEWRSCAACGRDNLNKIEAEQTCIFCALADAS